MVSKVSMGCGLEGWFRFRIKNAETGEERVVGPFRNLILNNGLNGIGTNGASWVSNVYLSTGTASPTEGDTSMQVTGSAISKGSPSFSNFSQTTTFPRYQGTIWSYTFAQGAATGNWTEVGIGRAVNNLWSRELIRDSAGNAITLTVLAIDILTVEYELRVYYKETDTTGTINISGSNYDYIIRPISTDSSFTGWMVSGSWMSGGTSSAASIWNGELNAPYTVPGGTQVSSGLIAGPTISSYVSNSYTKTITYTWGISGGNLAGGITVVAPYVIGDAFNGGARPFKIGFTPAIPKDNTKQLSLTFSFTWARRT